MERRKLGAGDEEGWAQGEKKVSKNLGFLFLHLRSCEDLGPRRGQLGSVGSPTIAPRKDTSSSLLFERTEDQMPQVQATWWEGIHCSCRAGLAHTNKPGSAKGVWLHPVRQTPGEAFRNGERAGQGIMPLQLPARATTTMGSTRMSQ